MLEKSLNFISEKDQVGPTTDLFFHELTEKESKPKRYFDIIIGTLASIFFLAILPLLALLIVVTSGSPVFRREKFVGYRGKHFTRHFLRTHKTRDCKNKTLLGSFLIQTRLYKAPNLLNVLKGEMSLVGPTPLRPTKSEKLNKYYTDFYKRYATKPGIIGTMKEDLWDLDSPREQLDKNLKGDLYYMVYPTLKKDFRIINGVFGNNQSKENRISAS